MLLLLLLRRRRKVFCQGEELGRRGIGAGDSELEILLYDSCGGFLWLGLIDVLCDRYRTTAENLYAGVYQHQDGDIGRAPDSWR